MSLRLQDCPVCGFPMIEVAGSRSAVCRNCGYKEPCCYAPGVEVRLRAGGGPMTILRTARGGDGTGGDGLGLLCFWREDDGQPAIGWVSESSVELCPPQGAL